MTELIKTSKLNSGFLVLIKNKGYKRDSSPNLFYGELIIHHDDGTLEYLVSIKIIYIHSYQF